MHYSPILFGRSDASAERIKFLEKSFADAEALNVALTKDLAVLRQEHSQVLERTEELEMEHNSLKEGFELVCKTEGEAVEKVKALEEKLGGVSSEVKQLKESNAELEGMKSDFDVKFEMAIEKKEVKIKELQEMLEEAYKESGSSVEEIQARNRGVVEQKTRISELEKDLEEKEALIVEAKEQKAELEELKEGMVALSQELDKLTSEKSEAACKSQLQEEKLAALETNLAEKEEESVKIMKEKENLEMSNMAMLGDLDDLQKKLDDSEQKKSELLVSSAELERFVVEMKEEISQLKQEVSESNKSKEDAEVENQQLKMDLEDAIMGKEEAEAGKEEMELAVKELRKAKEVAEKEKEEAVLAKQSLEEFINTSSNSDEIENLKQELKEMEEQLSNAGTAAMMNKLSATLVGLEESVLAAADCSVMPGGGQDADCTIGNQTLGGGVPMEVSFNIMSSRKDFHVCSCRW